MIKLVITDLDGTFLNSQGSFDKNYYSRVKKMMDAHKVIFAACTGKQCERVEELFDTLDTNNMWIMGDSATRIKQGGRYVYESLLPNDLGLKIIHRLEEIADDHNVIACTPTTAYIKSTVSEENAKRIRGSYAVVKTLDDLQEITEDFVKIPVYDAKERCFDSVKNLSDFKNQAYIVASEAAWIDISNYNVHKGTTVQELQKILGISKKETIGFGDGLNDVELFDSVGCSFAVENAFEEVKEKADFVTKSNDDSGVLQTIEKLLILQGK